MLCPSVDPLFMFTRTPMVKGERGSWCRAGESSLPEALGPLLRSAFPRQEQGLYLNSLRGCTPAEFPPLSGIVQPLRKAWTKAGNRTADDPPRFQNVDLCKRLQGLRAPSTQQTQCSPCKGISRDRGMQRLNLQPVGSPVPGTPSTLIPLSRSPLYFNQFTQRLSR